MFKIFVNFKTYPQGTGEEAVGLARVLQEEQEELEGKEGQEIKIIPIVQATDIFRIKKEIKIPVWSQHLDWQSQGAFTGWQNLETMEQAGASGTLLNHSEHQIPPGMIKQTLARCKAAKLQRSKDFHFETMVCCKTLGQMERLVKLKPDYIGYEISELIGGKVSIADHDPGAIKHAKEYCQNIPLIVGAGIHQAEDLAKAKSLGADGVLISSAIVLAENPKEKLNELLKLLK